MYRLQLDVRFTIARVKSVFAQRRHEAFGVEHGFGFEHEIDSAGQLDGEHGIGLELIVEPRFEALGQGPMTSGSAVRSCSLQASRL